MIESKEHELRMVAAGDVDHVVAGQIQLVEFELVVHVFPLQEGIVGGHRGHGPEGTVASFGTLDREQRTQRLISRPVVHRAQGRQGIHTEGGFVLCDPRKGATASVTSRYARASAA